MGAGGREHALAWKMAESPQVTQVFVAPGNPGTAAEPGVENVAIPVTDAAALLEFACARRVDLCVIGPEVPLVAGLADRFRERGLRCFGPSAAAARLEGSKSFAKRFMQRHAIPTAAFKLCSRPDEATAWIDGCALPVVIKADGLAAGKGVVVAGERDTALEAAAAMLSGERFGEAGRQIVVEEFLPGEEASFMVISDGEHILPLASSRDHKARDDGGRGPNTGGMGACSPAPALLDEAMHERILREIMRPAIDGLRAEGMPYCGFLYAGLMIDAEGNPRVLEFNCRLGDPEAQVVLARLRGELDGVCLAACDGRLDACRLDWEPGAAVGVVLAAAGYPGAVRCGDRIAGLEHFPQRDVRVFHAGTTRQQGQLVTAGGRVLCVLAQGANRQAARQRAYQACERIAFDGMFYRRDIGAGGLADDPLSPRPSAENSATV